MTDIVDDDGFNFDLDRMRRAVEGEAVSVPSDITTAAGFRAWLLSEGDRIENERLIKLCEERSYTMPTGLTREERHAWAKQTLAADEFHQEAQRVLTSRGRQPGIPAPSSAGLTEEQYHEVMAQYQRQIRLYGVIVQGTPIESYPEGLYWDEDDVSVRIEFGTLSFQDKMAVYNMYLQKDCKHMSPSARDQAANVMMKILRLNV